MFTELACCQGISMYQVQLHAYTCPLYNVLLEEINCLHTFKHDNVHRVAEFHLFTKFHVCQCSGY